MYRSSSFFYHSNVIAKAKPTKTKELTSSSSTPVQQTHRNTIEEESPKVEIIFKNKPISSSNKEISEEDAQEELILRTLKQIEEADLDGKHPAFLSKVINKYN